MKNLELYISKKNFMNDLFNKPLININALTLEDVKNLYDSLDCDMSPENISCDGELSYGEVKKRSKFYNAVLADLEKMGFKAAR